ncbi:MAG: YdbL family protein [Rhodanobacter sp.]
MRKFIVLTLATLAVVLVGCVTINVYFPEAAAQKAADKFVDTVLGAPAPGSKPADKPAPPAAKDTHRQPSAMLLDLLVPAAYAADTPDVRVETAATEAIRARMRTRFDGTLGALLDSGAAGFTRDGMVAMRDPSKLPLSQRAQANAALADENRDRAALYREVASANGHPEWEAQIRATFARTWIDKAHPGWYFQDAGGSWQKK